jgi:hypothetical protein
MGGSALRRGLEPGERAIVVFELWGPVDDTTKIDKFNQDFANLINGKGTRLSSEVWEKETGDVGNW